MPGYVKEFIQEFNNEKIIYQEYTFNTEFNTDFNTDFFYFQGSDALWE